MSVDEAPKASHREWVGLAVLALPCLLYSMDLEVLYLAVPKLSADLGPTSSQLLWITDIYGFLLAGFLITMGTLGDRIGRRRLLMIGAGAFGAASVLAAFSTSSEMLIAARALLGIAGATLAPSTLSLIRNMFLDPDQRTFAIGVWATSFSAGAALGPLAGGALLQFFWWGSVFLVAVPVMALLLMLGPALLPDSRDPEAGRLAQSSAVARRCAGGDLRSQAGRPGGHGRAAAALHSDRTCRRGHLRAQATNVGRSVDRPGALPDALLHRVTGRVRAQHFRDSGNLPLHRAVFAAGAGALADGGGIVDGALVRRAHRRIDAGPADRAPGPPGLRDGLGPGALCLRLRDAHPGQRGLRTRDPRDRVRRPRLGRRPGGYPGNRYYRRECPARASRGGVGDLGDKRRVRWGFGYRCPGQHRNRRLPQRGSRRLTGQSSTRGGLSRPRHFGRCRCGGRPALRPTRCRIASRRPRGVYPGAATERQNERCHRIGYSYPHRGLAATRERRLRGRGSTGTGAGWWDRGRQGPGSHRLGAGGVVHTGGKPMIRSARNQRSRTRGCVGRAPVRAG